MEKDVNLIIDIGYDEAKQLLKLIEILFENWYIARHNNKELCKNIGDIADEKRAQQKGDTERDK